MADLIIKRRIGREQMILFIGIASRSLKYVPFRNEDQYLLILTL